jgi:hypothetical protein
MSVNNTVQNSVSFDSITSAFAGEVITFLSGGGARDAITTNVVAGGHVLGFVEGVDQSIHLDGSNDINDLQAGTFLGLLNPRIGL